KPFAAEAASPLLPQDLAPSRGTSLSSQVNQQKRQNYGTTSHSAVESSRSGASDTLGTGLLVPDAVE
nr:hypothetical protein [Candidatus Freyarchaeota archaeon]